MTLADLEKEVVETAVHALCGSGSITAECRRDAAVLVLVWAQASDETVFHDDMIERKRKEAYRYFEFNEPAPSWAIWELPSPSPSV